MSFIDDIVDTVKNTVEKVVDDVVEAAVDVSKGDVIGAIENVVDAVETVNGIEEKL